MLPRISLFGGSAFSTSHTSKSPSLLLSAFLLLSALGALPAQATDVLETSGFSTCLATSDIKVDKMNVKYDKANGSVTFDLAGSSSREQKVKAVLTVTAYGRKVYEQTIDPCAQGIAQLCPLPKGTFAAKDTMEIPPQYASLIPAIAFQIPDLDGMAKLQLVSTEGNQQLACLQSVVQNGKTADQPGVKYVTAGIAAAALVLTGVSALGAAGAGAGSGAGPSPNFGDVIGWFQNIAMNGMLSVNYPPVYRSFVSNFAWSTGILPWEDMQRSIDTFRKVTGGHLENNSIDYLMNATLVYSSDSSTESGNMTSGNKTRRALDWTVAQIFERSVEVNGTTIAGNGTNSTSTDGGAQGKVMHYVHGIQAYVEKLQIPSANTFMTVLLIFAIVIAAIAVCILLFKVILEAWSLFGSFPKSLTGFRKRYWGFLATTIVRLVLVLYGTWTLYCLYQFRNGDSWGAHVLAGVTLAVFTGVLAFFAIRIFILARRQKAIDDENEAAALKGGEHKPHDRLFEHKPYMRRYGLFYDQFKTDFWWIFLPLIIYAFAKGAFIALGDGHGLVQTVGQLTCEVILLVLLLWNRPYNSKAGNVLNTIISVVRVLSVVCLIIFVEELNIAADTKTVTGVALIVIQSVLTAALAICIAVNAIIVMCKENPHTKRRKELEKQREADNLTPLGPRNSILGAPVGHGPDGKGRYSATPSRDDFLLGDGGGRTDYPLHYMTPAPPPQHPFSHNRSASSSTDRQGLMNLAAPMPLAHGRHDSQGGYDEHHRGAPYRPPGQGY